MRLRFRSGVIWKYSMVAISKIIEEASLKVDQDGVKLRAMDPSGVVLVDFHIPSRAFYEYEVPSEMIIGLNMEDFAKILRRAKKGDELLLEMESPGRLSVVFEGKGSRRFTLPTIDISYQEIPEISFEEIAKCKILPKTLKDVVRELEELSDSIEFQVPEGEDALVIRAESELAEAEVVLSVSSGVLLEFDSTGPARSRYTMDYLSEIVTASQVAETTQITFGNDTPLRIIYELPEGGMLQFYVAPRSD